MEKRKGIFPGFAVKEQVALLNEKSVLVLLKNCMLVAWYVIRSLEA